MINTVSLKIARQIKHIVPDHPRSEEVLKYAISFLINTFSIVFLTLLISIFTNRITEALIVLIGFAVFRQVSGGAHLRSGLLCIVVSTIALTAFTLVNFSNITLMMINLTNLLLAGLFAPSILHKPLSSKQRFQLKLLSLLVVASNLIFNSPALATAFLVQCLTLILGKKELKR